MTYYRYVAAPHGARWHHILVGSETLSQFFWLTDCGLRIAEVTAYLRETATPGELCKTCRKLTP